MKPPLASSPAAQAPAQQAQQAKHLKLYGELAKCSPQEHYDLWLLQGKTLLESGDAPRARLVLQTLVSCCSDELAGARAHLWLAKACLQLSSDGYQEALETARAAVARCQQFAAGASENSAKLCLAVCLGQASRSPLLSSQQRTSFREEGRQVALQVVESNPTDPAACYNLALLLAEENELDKSMQFANSALGAAIKGQTSYSRPSLALLSLLLSAKGKVRDAVEVVNAGLSSSTGVSGGALEHEVLLYRIKAAMLQVLGDFRNAIMGLGTARKMLSRAANTADISEHKRSQYLQHQALVWHDLARAFISQDQLTDAQNCVEHMQQLAPWAPATHYAAGEVHEALGNTPLAIGSYETAMALQPGHPKSLLKLGALYQQRGGSIALCQARNMLLEGLRSEPYNAEGWYYLGCVCRDQGHPEEAEKYLSKAVTLSQRSPLLPYDCLPYLMS